MIHQYCEKDGIIISLDADDWFTNDEAVAYVVGEYNRRRCLLSYGDCYLWNGNDNARSLKASEVGLFNIPYPRKVQETNSYRDYHFLPHHAMTYAVQAFKQIRPETFRNSEGEWFKFCQDQVIFFPLLEMFGDNCAVFTEPLVMYNQATIGSIIKAAKHETIKEDLEIRRQVRYEPQRL